MKELKAIRKAVRKWRKKATTPPFTATGALLACASDLEALLPALEAACADLQNRRERNFNSAVGLRTAVNELRTEPDELEAQLPALAQQIESKAREIEILRNAVETETRVTRGLEAEIAALREPMTCGHPRACWRAVKPDSVDAVVGYRCVACEDKHIAVAAARKDAAEFIRPHWGDSDMLADEWLKLLSEAAAQAHGVVERAATMTVYRQDEVQWFTKSELDAYVQEKVDQRDDEWVAAFGAQDLEPRVAPERLAKWVFRDIEQQLEGLQAEVDRAVLAESEWWANETGHLDSQGDLISSNCTACERLAANRAKKINLI